MKRKAILWMNYKFRERFVLKLLCYSLTISPPRSQPLSLQSFILGILLGPGHGQLLRTFPCPPCELTGGHGQHRGWGVPRGRAQLPHRQLLTPVSFTGPKWKPAFLLAHAITRQLLKLLAHSSQDLKNLRLWRHKSQGSGCPLFIPEATTVLIPVG